MKISDLKFGETGYWATGWGDDVESVKFVECKIDGQGYVAAIGSGGIELGKTFKHFFGTFGKFCDSPDSHYHRNIDCYLTREEALEAQRIKKIDRKIRELEEKKNSLVKTKLQLLKLEQEILELDLKKEVLELEKQKNS